MSTLTGGAFTGSNMVVNYAAPSGVAGSISRSGDYDAPTVMLSATNTPTSFGSPITLSTTGQAQKVTSAASSTSLKGLLVRSVPNYSGSTGDTSFTTNTPNATYPHGRLTRGYMHVACPTGTPVAGGAVYIRVVTAGSKAIGDIEATADGSNNFVWSNVEWAANGKDANNIAELKLKGI